MLRLVFNVIILIISTLVIESICLKNVRLHLEPEIVERGYETTAKCEYDLEGDPLFSLKWYRGNYEFYRYFPSEDPPIKMFNSTWINVDMKKSNETQVTIQDVGFHLDGNFSCEVTTDAPPFLTANSWRSLSVVSSPKKKPLIISESDEYVAGEVLRANCSSPPSKPPVKLTLMLNDITIAQSENKRNNSNSVHWVDGNPQFGSQSVQIKLPLRSSHFINGQIILRCISEIPLVYLATSELRLESKIKDPIPEKVTSDSPAIDIRYNIIVILLAITVSISYG